MDYPVTKESAFSKEEQQKSLIKEKRNEK